MEIGSAVGPYRILRLLGSGGMGAVWLAEDTRLHRQVALKTLRAADNHDAQSRARLMREARAAAALKHPNIATVHDVIEADGQVVIVFEYVEGETLAVRLARGPLPVAEAIGIACQLARALAAAHAHAVVHRDLKPSNLIVGADGEIKVLDFGISRLLATDTTATVNSDTTSGPGLVGTPGYAAPEQMVSSAVDERADLYSLGVLLFEMVSGRRPFPSNDRIALATSKLSTDAPPLSSSAAQAVSPELDRVVASLLAREPDARPSSAKDVLQQLQGILGVTVSTSPPRARKRPSRTLGIAAAVLLAALAGSGVWWQWRSTRQKSEPPPPVVAVLPLVNISGDPSRDFVAAGISESLISSLAALPTVTVLSRASVAEARGRSSHPSALARDLGATYFVEGSVQESGGRLRVSLNLVRSDRSVAWGDNVEGVFERIFDLQARLATALTSALAVRVSARDRERMNLQPTTSPEALSTYWRGRALLERRDVKGNLDAAATAFSEALTLDSRFALAHAALGEAYWYQYVDTRDPSWAQKATEEGLTALRLNAGEAAVRYTLAVTLAGTGKLEEAAEELRHALAIQPNYDDARRQLGSVLARQGKTDEAIEEFKRAVSARPTAWDTYSAMGLVLFSAARYEEAAKAFEQVTILQPDNHMGFQQLGTALQAIGKKDLALENYERAINLRPSPHAYSNIGTLRHWKGEYALAVQAYEHAIKLRPRAATTHRNLGDALTKLGRTKAAHIAYGEAVRLSEEDLKVNPSDPSDMASLAVHLQKFGDAGKAEARIAEALSRAPADVDVLFRAAEVHALAGRTRAALEALRLAVDGGYSRTLIAEEEDFDGLRGVAEFRALVASNKQ